MRATSRPERRWAEVGTHPDRSTSAGHEARSPKRAFFMATSDDRSTYDDSAPVKTGPVDTSAKEPPFDPMAAEDHRHLVSGPAIRRRRSFERRPPASRSSTPAARRGCRNRPTRPASPRFRSRYQRATRRHRCSMPIVLHVPLDATMLLHATHGAPERARRTSEFSRAAARSRTDVGRRSRPHCARPRKRSGSRGDRTSRSSVAFHRLPHGHRLSRRRRSSRSSIRRSPSRSMRSRWPRRSRCRSRFLLDPGASRATTCHGPFNGDVAGLHRDAVRSATSSGVPRPRCCEISTCSWSRSRTPDVRRRHRSRCVRPAHAMRPASQRLRIATLSSRPSECSAIQSGLPR